MLGIIIPAYKRKEPLREALQSLVNQTYQKFFVIVVDYHSPQPLKEITDEFQSSLNILYIYADKNGGPGAARQIGLNICYANNLDLVMFLDSDDKLFPQAVARLTYEINHTRSDIVSSGIWQEDGNGMGAKIEPTNVTWLHGKIYRTAYLKEKQINFANIRTNEDLAFNMAALGLTEQKKLIDESLYLFSHESNSITRGSVQNFQDCISKDYISAIYYAILKIKEVRSLKSKEVINIFNCYNYYQNILVLGQEASDLTKQELKYLLSIKEAQNFLHNTRFMASLVKEIASFLVLKKEIYYYKQTFEEWLQEFLYEDSDN